MPWFWPSAHVEDSTSVPPSSLISGISDGTLLLAFFAICLIVLWIDYSRRRRATQIHPENQQDVQLLRQRSQSDGGASSSYTGQSRQDTCPICLTDASVLTVKTNCGHVFCGKCIISYWKFQSNWTSGMRCPVCRQQVTVLLTCFTAEEQAARLNADRQLVIDGVKDFNRRFSGAPRTYREYFYDIPVLIPHIFRQILSVEGLAWASRLRILLIVVSVIVYVISPLDILPESVLGIFGLLDDLLIAVYGALQMIIVFRQNLASA